MRPPAGGLGAALLVLVVAGCLSPAQPAAPPALPPPLGGVIDHDLIDRLIGTPIHVDHDHLDVAQHTGSFNMGFVAWSDLGITLGDNGFANFVFYQDEDEDLAFLAVDGDTMGGFVIADVSDPRNITPLGRYWIQGNGIQEVRVTPDGRYAIMNVQEIPQAPTLLDGEGLKDCSTCLHLVDVQDRANPKLVGVLPVDLIGSHNMHLQPYGSDLYLFYVGQPLGNSVPGNYVGIARLMETPLGLQAVKVAEYRNHEAPLDPKRSFPHDVYVEEHPLTGQVILYVSHWEGGAITVDVTNPLAPVQLDIYKDPAPSEVSNIHWFAPEPAPRGERLVGWSAPEIGGLETGSGVMRAYDLTDPADIQQVATWELPGDVFIPGQFIFSPHITIPDMERGLLAVSHYHAGVWVLDITTPEEPRALGYYIPHGDPAQPYHGPIWWKKPNFDPEGYFPNVYQARWKDDLLWVSERGSGLYVLDYTGPVPGSLAERP